MFLPHIATFLHLLLCLSFLSPLPEIGDVIYGCPLIPRVIFLIGMIFKVHIFREGYKILRNIHLTFDWHYIGQRQGEDFAKFWGLLRIYKL